MSASQSSGNALTRDTILRALSSLADELAQREVTGEVCLFGGTVMVLASLVGQYYPPDRIPVKTQYLVEGLFEEGKV